MDKKVISLAAAKARQAQIKNQVATALTMDQVLETFHEVVMYPQVFVRGLVNRLVPYVDIDFFDADGLRGFLVDVINYIINDEESIHEWITSQLTDGSRVYGELFPGEPKTKEERLSQTAYNILTSSGFRKDVLEFAASVFWVISGDYGHEKQIAIDDFIAGAIIRNYDYETEFSRTLGSALSHLPTWFVHRTMNDTWFFAAIMTNGDLVEFASLDRIVNDDGLYADITVAADKSIDDSDIHEYSKKAIIDNRMSILVKNIVSRIASDGTIWMDAELVGTSAYDICRRPNVSINAKHVIHSQKMAGEDDATMIYFPVPSLRIPKEECSALRLCDVVMVFETADT